MKTSNHFRILASVSCVLALAACDSIKDVPNEDAASLPPQTIVLSGQINGLSSLRAITLMNNGDTINTRSFINAAPTVPNEGVRPVPFSFGSIAVGTSYRIEVKQQPEFKNCVVVGGVGVLTAGVRPDIVINCTNTTARHDLTVHIPSNAVFFKSLQDAKVRVTTEEEIREVAVASIPGTTVVFEDVLLNATGTANPATWSVTATTFEGNRINKCVVTAPSGSNSAGNVSTPVVGAVPVSGVAPNQVPTSLDAQAPACQFTVGGKVAYSLPPGETTIPAIAGLRLQLRDMQMNALEDLDVATCTPANANTTTTTLTTTLGATVPTPSTVTCQYRFNVPVRSSSTDGLYEVAVLQHPVDQYCVVVNAGSASVFTLGLTPPVNVDNANVFCRATPPANRQLRGVFRLVSTTFVANAITGSTPVPSAWEPFDLTKWNTASSNMMAFFDNGTFLYGTHANGAQVEHGFYDYDDVAQTLRFTSIVDTNTATAFPANFSPLPNITNPNATTSINNLTTTTQGLSALPNPIRRNGTTQAPTVTGFANLHAAMTGVTLGTVTRELDVGATNNLRTISGTFGADQAGITSYALNTTTACSATAPCLDPATGALITKTLCTQADPCVRATTGVADVFGNNPNPPNNPTTTCVAPSAPCHMPNYAYRVSWILEEPPQVDGEMTGAWTTQDSRRLWVWDYRTYYGTSVAMMGGSPTMNDACFTLEDIHASGGIYTRRGTITGCYPFSRPGNDPVSGLPGVSVFGSLTPRNGAYNAYAVGFNESVDFSLSTTPLVQLPGFTGRHPGGEPAPGAMSPSPIYWHVDTASAFAESADETYFPSPPTSWCTTEILGLRATANGFPINYPHYFCRTRAN